MEEGEGREDIPLRDFPQPEYQEEGDWDDYQYSGIRSLLDGSRYRNDYDDQDGAGPSGETSFTEKKDLDFLLDSIEDTPLKERLIETFKYLDDDPRIFKVKDSIVMDAVKKSVYDQSLLDYLDEPAWDGLIISEERKKLDWERRVNTFNEVLQGRDIFIDRENPRVFEIFENYIQETLTGKMQEINGYKYKGKIVLKRGRDRTFRTVKGKALSDLLSAIKFAQDDNARSIIKDYVKWGDNAEGIASEYIGEMRNEQETMIASFKDVKELNRNIERVTDLEKDIQKVRRNKKFKIRARLFAKTLGGALARLRRYIWFRKKQIVGVVATVLGVVVGTISTGISIKNAVNDAVKHGAHLISKASEVAMNSLAKLAEHVDFIKNLIPWGPGALRRVGYL